ncbi:MAG: diguanylate cyclase [Oleiphilaceae bacterium]|nr:diguanylate cyclase [Oleiphilaceae bacterium]
MNKAQTVRTDDSTEQPQSPAEMTTNPSKPQQQPKEQWREEQIVAILYGNARGAMSGSMISIVLVSYVLSSHFTGWTIWMWCAVGLALNCTRWMLHRTYLHRPESHSTRAWLNWHRIFTFLSGSLYGSMAVLFFTSEEPLYQLMVIFLVGGMGAAAVGTHGVDLVTYRLFLYAGIIPMILRALAEQTQVHNALALLLLLMTAIMLRSAKQTRSIMLENIDMSFSLHYRATHDGLVGLLNRDEFQNLFEHTMQNQPPRALITAMIFIDLDNFKSLNDQYGHRAGDEALIGIGEIIRQAIRHDDIAARFGGDEFMILLRCEHVEDAHKVAEKIQAGLRAYVASQKHQNSQLGASIGIGYSRHHSIKYEALLVAADRACYQAKHQGKGKVCLQEVL